jgi:hypothetical protein
MIITYVYADNSFEWNTSNWRCVIPARAINRTGRHMAHLMSLVDFNKGLKESQNLCEQSDMIVVERNFALDTLGAIIRWKAKDKVVVGNFDDAYQLMPPTNTSYAYWKKGEMRYRDADGKESITIIKPKPLIQFVWGLRTLDAITVSSKLLAEDWQEYTDAYYFPNYFDVNNYLKAAAPPHEGTIIGWGGSLSHVESFDGGVLPALKQVCKQRPHVKVMIVGDKRVYDMLDVPLHQKIYMSFVPFERWPNVISEFDIGLAPLYGPYDSRRSWIKPLEYSLLKMPWIASENPAYEELREYGVLVRNTAPAWQEALLDMVDHLDMHRRRAELEPYQFALKQSSDQNVDTMLKIYAEIIYKSTGRVMKI